MDDKLVVMLSTEGTYPFHQGGVSTWCDILIHKLKSVDYVIYSVLMDPFVTQKFKLPGETELVKMPLWGTEEPSEHLKTPFSQSFLAKRRTNETAIKEKFIPLFTELIQEIVSLEKKPIQFGQTLLSLYHYFQEYDFKLSFKSELTWDTFKRIIRKTVDDPKNRFGQPDIYCLIQSLGWIYRFFNIVNTPVPKAHVSHASAAAFCGIPCVIAKLEHKTPFLLTEHGVYLREQYLSLAKRDYSSFLNTFLIRMIHTVTSMNYAYADQVSPVCHYNTRWERKFDVLPENIEVIYNGVDQRIFKEAPGVKTGPLTVVTVARIDPIKDILSLIRSADIVRRHVPEVQYVVYGSVSVPEYYEECVKLRDQLGLQQMFTFAGHTSNMAAAYQSGDVIVLSSISEAFPYSVVEAMMTAKPVVATDVGGIKEALSHTGILVTPFDVEGLAEGTIRLLQNPELREAMGKEGKERALNFFTLDRVLELHLKSYIKLAVGAKDAVDSRSYAEAASSKQFVEKAKPIPNTAVERFKESAKQKLFIERGYALLLNGFYREAIVQFRSAIAEHEASTSTPVLLLEIAYAYKELGEHEQAINEMEKYELLLQFAGQLKPA
ncbi:GT4 family glycosyltransferase PelF [Paenibacillus sp. GCM10027628]|uniref:GT4 family glycosyltransferase PelF n=1 Tax=Paenibacillus sp. GCM10027628 TaxID=3273413 RepID=UPI00363F3056